MGKGMQGILRGLIQAGMYLAYRPKVVYKNQQAMEVMNGDAPVVFICNHMSHKDGALIASVLHKKQPYFLIAKDWYEKKQFEGFLRTYGSVPVDRTGMDTSWYDACRKLLEAGHSILIFPEGKTSKGEMNAFQPGFAVLAEKTGAKVVECAHIGSYHLFFGERKRILIGDSYTLECPKDMRKSAYAKQIAGQARERILHMKEILETMKSGKLKFTGDKADKAAWEMTEIQGYEKDANPAAPVSEAAATEEPQQ
mgnify:FL=1|jgi:1-acyl-sn-glycerol-3-phosphate acyltransferase